MTMRRGEVGLTAGELSAKIFSLTVDNFLALLDYASQRARGGNAGQHFFLGATCRFDISGEIDYHIRREIVPGPTMSARGRS